MVTGGFLPATPHDVVLSGGGQREKLVSGDLERTS